MRSPGERAFQGVPGRSVERVERRGGTVRVRRRGVALAGGARVDGSAELELEPGELVSPAELVCVGSANVLEPGEHLLLVMLSPGKRSRSAPGLRGLTRALPSPGVRSLRRRATPRRAR